MFSGWVLEQNLAGVTPTLDAERLSALDALPAPPTSELPDRLLLAMVRLTPQPGALIDVDDDRLPPAIYSAGSSAVHWLAQSLEKRGLVERVVHEAEVLGEDTKEYFRVTPEGVMRAEEARRGSSPSAQAFVAMWFTEAMVAVYDNGFAPAIVAAGYRPFRVDRSEHINKIDDEIISQLRRSRFVVADFTGHRGGVYFEAGYALGRDVPVIWCCRKDEIVHLHFDIRQYNCIDWDDAGDLRVLLQARVEATMGDGPLKAP